MPVLLRRPLTEIPRQRNAQLLASLVCLLVLGASTPLFAQASSNCTDTLSSDCGISTSTQSASSTDALQNGGITNGGNWTSEQRTGQGNQVYIDSAGTSVLRQPLNAADLNNFFPADPMTDMQRLAQASTGEALPIFGRDLFQRAPSTFAPADQIPSMADYVVGPGDVILVRLWGPESFNGQLTVDSSGSIFVPQVGAIHVAGLRVDQLQSQVSSEIQHSFRNFSLSINLGHLRSIQVYVVGDARRPGAYTVSSLSTVLNVLFVSGGPSVQGSLRRIELRRQGKVVSELDLYDLILKGDRTHDVRLQPDDTIFIPSVGPQAALAGSVRHPAIYELRSDTTLGSLLELAGGFTPTGSTTSLSLERIEENRARTATTVDLDSADRALLLRDGDVLYVNHITSAYQQSVTIRGNLANPGRFPWHAGMRLSDIIPDRMSLLTNNYWQQRNRLGVPVPLFEPQHPVQRTPQQKENSAASNALFNGSNQPGSSYANENADGNDPTGASELATGSDANYRRTDETLQESSTGSSDAKLSRTSLADQQQSATSGNISSLGQRNTIRIPAPEIDWSYAVIERLDPNALKSSLVPFSLEKLLKDHDPAQNLELQPGDIITILSQADVHVPQDDQTKYVRLEGEFKGAGVYSVGPNETLDDLVRRAGGLTTKAYLYGSSFTRESARIQQQQRLDEYITSVSIKMQRDAAVRAASSTSGADPNILTEQRDAVDQLRKLRATGRVVLEFRPDSAGLDSIPHIPMEDGDVFRVPSRPLTVDVIGAVYGQNVFLYDPNRRVQDYLLLAGKPNRYADKKNAFIIRADGSVYSRERSQGAWKNSFDIARINPGDTIVIPEQPIKPSFVRQFIDYSQIFSQFALSAAYISLIKDE